MVKKAANSFYKQTLEPKLVLAIKAIGKPLHPAFGTKIPFTALPMLLTTSLAWG